MMSTLRVKCCAAGEFKIEQVPFHEMEIKRKGLLPISNHFHNVTSSWNGRGLWGKYIQCFLWGFIKLETRSLKKLLFVIQSEHYLVPLKAMTEDRRESINIESSLLNQKSEAIVFSPSEHSKSRFSC